MSSLYLRMEQVHLHGASCRTVTEAQNTQNLQNAEFHIFIYLFIFCTSGSVNLVRRGRKKGDENRD